MLASDNSNPHTARNVIHAKRMLQYINTYTYSSPNVGLLYNCLGYHSEAEVMTLQGYSDSDFARHHSKCSRLGAIVYLCGAPIY